MTVYQFLLVAFFLQAGIAPQTNLEEKDEYASIEYEVQGKKKANNMVMKHEGVEEQEAPINRFKRSVENLEKEELDNEGQEDEASKLENILRANSEQLNKSQRNLKLINQQHNANVQQRVGRTLKLKQKLQLLRKALKKLSRTQHTVRKQKKNLNGGIGDEKGSMGEEERSVGEDEGGAGEAEGDTVEGGEAES